MDEKEIEVLRRASIIPSTKKGSGVKTSKHTVFVENDEEGEQRSLHSASMPFKLRLQRANTSTSSHVQPTHIRANPKNSGR
jgi:hypothetical protein